MNKIDLQYQQLLRDILDNGVEKKTRNGDTLSVFSRQIRHKMSEGFPLLTTKKMAWKVMVAELLWFLRGDTNIKFLLDYDCHIWDGDAFKNFMNNSEGDPDLIWNQEQFIKKIKNDEEFAKKWGDLGKIYGYQWRNFNGKIDQISELIMSLKESPDSRRMVVNAWNASDLPHQVLPPCHYGFQVYTRELTLEERVNLLKNINTSLVPTSKMMQSIIEPLLIKNNIPTRAISLMWNQRSVDTFLGLPFNIASYGLLLEIIAKEVNMVPDELIGNLGDTHLYLNHIEQAKEQIGREPYSLPRLKHMKTDDFYKSLSENLSLITHLDNTDFAIENYQSHPTIKAKLSN